MEQLVTPSGDTTALRGGQGRDLVLVHSLLTDRDAFRAVLPELIRRFRVTLINLPGFHGSRSIPGTLQAYQDWLLQALDGLEIRRDGILCGNGFGGTVALASAVAAPRRIARLLLCDVAAGFPEQGKTAFQVMAERARREGMASIAAIAAARVYHADYVQQHPEVIEERRRVLAPIDPIAFVAACEVLVACDLVPALGSLGIPTLITYGALDQATPPALNREIAAGLPNCEIFEIPSCGHCPPLEQPAAFLSAAGRFLDA